MCGRSAFPSDGGNEIATVTTQAGMALRRAGISVYNEYDLDSQTGNFHSSLLNLFREFNFMRNLNYCGNKCLQ